jgi:methyl-accepting chemotaxis protein
MWISDMFFKFENWAIMRKVKTIFGAVAALAFVIIAVVLIQSATTNDKINSVQQNGHNLGLKILPLTIAVGDIQRDVVQVQQFLTDISATRGEDGLDDGFEDAKHYAESFHRDVATARSYAKQLKDQKLMDALDNVSRDFGPYYQMGQAMAHAYIKGGTAAGNATMRQFDNSSLALQASVRSMIEISKNRSQKDVAALERGNDAFGSVVTTGSIVINLASVLLLLLCVVGGVACYRFIARPIIGIAKAIEEADGNPEMLKIPGTERGDDIGQIAAAMERFRLSILSQMEENSQLSKEREQQAEAAREAQKRYDTVRRQTFDEMAEKFEQSVSAIISSVSSSASNLGVSADQMKKAMASVSQETGLVATASSQASTNVQIVASAAEELAFSVREIADQISKQAQLTVDAEKLSHTGDNAAKALDHQTQNIGEIVSLINEIATQTNMLALNATIEAARAGAAGSSFAVVAQEVKRLAQQTGESAGEISDLIEGVHNHVASAVGSIHDVAGSLGNVRTIAVGISAAVEQQHLSTEEILRSAGEAAIGSEQVSNSMVNVANTVKLADSLSGNVKVASLDLTAQSALLNAAAIEFIRHLRAA